MATRTSQNAMTASLNAMSTRLNSGVVRIYSGTQPATPQTAESGTLLAQLTLNASSGSVANDGNNVKWTAAAITADSDADNTGTAGWFRVYRSGGFTSSYVEFDGAVGVEMTLSSNDIVQHGAVSITAMTYTLPM